MFYHLVFPSNDQKHCSNLSWKPALPANFVESSAHMLITFLYTNIGSLKIDIGPIVIFWIDTGQWWQDVCSVHIMRIVIPKSSGHQLLYSSFINKPTSFNWHKFTFKIIFVAFISINLNRVSRSLEDLLRLLEGVLIVFKGLFECLLNVFFHQVSPIN